MHTFRWVTALTLLATAACSTSSADSATSDTAAVTGDPAGSPTLSGYFVERAPENMSYGRDVDPTLIDTIEFRPGGHYTTNAFPNDGRDVPLRHAERGTWSIVKRPATDGYGYTLVLRSDAGAEKRVPMALFSNGTFQLAQGAAVSVFFPGTSWAAIEDNQLQWLAACDVPCPNEGIISGCTTASLTAPGCAENLCQPVRACKDGPTAPATSTVEDRALADKLVGSYASKEAEDDPFDGIIARTLRLDQNGRFDETDARGRHTVGYWGIERANVDEHGHPNASLVLTRLNGVSDSVWLTVKSPDVIELSQIPVTTRMYRQ